MIYAKSNPVGIDREIYRFQQALNEIGFSYDIYGRLYITNKDDVRLAEAYVGSGEYREIFVDDQKEAVFGFIVSGERTGLSFVRANIRLICSMRLDRVYTTTERSDEEAILRVLKAITHLINSDNEGEIITNIESVYEGIDVERFKYRDMHPWLNFAITFDVAYMNDLCRTEEMIFKTT